MKSYDLAQILRLLHEDFRVIADERTFWLVRRRRIKRLKLISFLILVRFSINDV